MKGRVERDSNKLRVDEDKDGLTILKEKVIYIRMYILDTSWEMIMTKIKKKEMNKKESEIESVNWWRKKRDMFA